LFLVLCWALWKHQIDEQKVRALQEEVREHRVANKSRQETISMGFQEVNEPHDGTTKTPHEEDCSTAIAGPGPKAEDDPEPLAEAEEKVPTSPSTPPTSGAVSPTRVLSRTTSPQNSQSSLGPKRDPVLVKRTPPTLTAEQQAHLDQILGRKLIFLDYETRQLRLKHGIRFVQMAESVSPRADIDPPEFFDENITKRTLLDVAELLVSIYTTAVVHVEAHAATRSGMIDPSVLNMTQQQSELVRSELITDGVEPDRLVAIGLPGSRGSGKSEIVLRITSY